MIAGAGSLRQIKTSVVGQSTDVVGVSTDHISRENEVKHHVTDDMVTGGEKDVQQMREQDKALSKEVKSLKSKIQELEQLARRRGLTGVLSFRPFHIEEAKSPTPA
ncbi:hypothetical protein BC332_10989 [Capsicum chinense]|nr:hypothetical protein BC332_10989 [Capsicum chinense]